MSKSLADLGRSRTRGIPNRGTQVHQSKLKYNRVTTNLILDKYEDDMSGGHFRHTQGSLKREADLLKEEIRLNKPEYPTEILDWLRYTHYIMEKTVTLMDEADWLFSGDITEESFKEGTQKCRKEILTYQG